MVDESSVIGRMGRYRRRKVDGRRPHRTVIAHSDEEWARVQSLAAAQGISVPRMYERALYGGDALSAARLTRIVDEMSIIQRAMVRTGTNINQIATVANATGDVSAPQILAAARHFDRQIKHVITLLESIKGPDGYDVHAPESGEGQVSGGEGFVPDFEDDVEDDVVDDDTSSSSRGDGL